MFSATQAYARAYTATNYEVRGTTISIGVRSRAVDRLLARYHARTGVFVTACNPRGRLSGAMTNARRTLRLTETARLAGWRHMPGVGVGHDPGWPPERSLLLFGLRAAMGAALGRSLRQNAIVAIARGQPARLVALR